MKPDQINLVAMIAQYQNAIKAANYALAAVIADNIGREAQKQFHICYNIAYPKNKDKQS